MKYKNKILFVCFIIAFGLLSNSCNNKQGKIEEKQEIVEQEKTVETEIETDHNHSATYQCPMKCEGEKSYEEAGTCPRCKMDLKEVELI